MTCRNALVLLVCSLVFWVVHVRAQVDQENWRPDKVVASFSAQQQEFRPSMDSMDSVQLWMPGWGLLNPVGYTYGVSAVNIREGGVNGPIIASSNPVYTPPLFEGTVGFGFSSAVPLVPGQLYALEPVWVKAGGGIFASTRIMDADYAGGRLYGNGEEVPFDLVFREGVGLPLIPEPAPWALLLIGLSGVSAVFLRDHRCLQRERPVVAASERPGYNSDFDAGLCVTGHDARSAL